jgi:GNAT superfamily N-acetyltransferase
MSNNDVADTQNGLAVIRTYLELRSPDELRGERLADPRVRVERVEDCPPSFYRYLYGEVGRRYQWVDRLGWSDDDIRAYLEQPELELWLLSRAGAPAGFFELRRHQDASVEIVYFGLLQDYLGLGLGRHLLLVAVERAWALGAQRVWLHTCTLDDPAALPNYLKRGFRPFRRETYHHPPAPGEHCER